MAARTIGFKGVLPFMPLMFEMRWTSFGMRLSKRFGTNAKGEEECLTILSKHSLSVLMLYFGSPIITVKEKKIKLD